MLVKRYRQARRCTNCGHDNRLAGRLTWNASWRCPECFEENLNPPARGRLDWARLFRMGILFLFGWKLVQTLVQEFSAQWGLAREYLLGVVIAIIGAAIGEAIYSALFKRS